MSSDRFDPNELRLAQMVLLYSRRRITAAAPALLVPIYALRDTPQKEPGPMGTDGTHLFYCPAQVLEDFRRDRDAPARQLLHITAHCLLGHREGRWEAADKKVFDALADTKVEDLVRMVLQRNSFHFGDEWMEVTGPIFWRGPLSRPVWYRRTLSSLYRDVCSDQDPDSRESLFEWGEKVKVDDHELWDRKKGFMMVISVGVTDGGEPDWAKMLQDIRNGSAGKLPSQMAGVIEADMEPAEENGISYREFLRQFACSAERMHTDPDSIDHRWYHLGLELYGDVPLLEPWEVSETPRPNDLVIALDTSGSCSGDVCRRFLRETLNLLADLAAGNGSFRVLLLQCDTEIQKELWVENREDADRLLEDFTPCGFGGTDFQPVFERVDELRRSGELPQVRGLLYLSDGFGEFPDTPPDYPVAFLIPKDDPDLWHPDIPDWVSVLELNECDYTVKEATET